MTIQTTQIGIRVDDDSVAKVGNVIGLKGYSGSSADDFIQSGGSGADLSYSAGGFAPVGSVVGWLKTFDSNDSGTTDGTTADKLVDAGQNFVTTVTIGDLVHNTTDGTFAYVTAIDDNENLSIDADIMVSGEAYTIYSTPALPTSWVECNGQVLSDAGSRYNGATIPDLNASSGTARFLRGAVSSGTEGGSETHQHTQVNSGNPSNEGSSAGNAFATNNTLTTATSTLPSYYETVWIMRTK